MRSKHIRHVRDVDFISKSFIYLSLLIFAAMLASCGASFQPLQSDNSSGTLGSLASDFGTVQISSPAAGSIVQLNISDNLDLSVTVTTANSVQVATWQKFDTASGTFLTVSGTTTEFNVSTGQTIDELTINNAQQSDNGTYRASVLVESLDRKTTQTFFSTAIQIVVPPNPVIGPIPPTPTPTPTSTPKAPTPTPITPTSEVSWVYYNGTYVWDYITSQRGDWDSNLTSDYSFTPTTFKCLTGTRCIQQVPAAAWGIWIPYPQNPNNPNPNDTVNHPGIGININGYNYFTIAVYPTQAGFTPTIAIDFAFPGKVDQSGGNCVGLASGGDGGNNCVQAPTAGAWGPDPMVPNQWNVYNVPISAFNVGTILQQTKGWIYKFLLQEQGNDSGSNQQTYYLDQVGFSVSPVK